MAAGARGLARGAFGEPAAGSRVSTRTFQQASGAGRALDVAVFVQTGKLAVAARFATAGSAAALAGAAGIVTGAGHVAGTRFTGK